MSFKLFIYYCALCGGWAAFLGWGIGLFLSPSSPLGNVGIRGMWLGMFIAFGLGLVDALWNVPLVQVQVLVPAGTMEETSREHGAATLVAWLITRGSTSRTAAELASEMESLGGTIASNATTEGVLGSDSQGQAA